MKLFKYFSIKFCKIWDIIICRFSCFWFSRLNWNNHVYEVVECCVLKVNLGHFIRRSLIHHLSEYFMLEHLFDLILTVEWSSVNVISCGLILLHLHRDKRRILSNFCGCWLLLVGVIWVGHTLLWLKWLSLLCDLILVLLIVRIARIGKMAEYRVL